jgi:hypothetical protein
MAPTRLGPGSGRRPEISGNTLKSQMARRNGSCASGLGRYHIGRALDEEEDTGVGRGAEDVADGGKDLGTESHLEQSQGEQRQAGSVSVRAVDYANKYSNWKTKCRILR